MELIFLSHSKAHETNKVSLAMFLVTIGIVYGDIGTSPLYVMKSIMNGNGGITQVNTDFIIGSLSLVFWAVTLLTTCKYVLIAMKADNNGEGGIFSLYALVKKCGKWLIIPAMLGGSALLADGVLTPAVTVTTAVEGLRSIPAMNAFLGAGQTKVVIITLIIIISLFSIQHSGTSSIGKAFGPVMFLWFSFLAVTGIPNIIANPVVLKCFNPIYAIKVLISPYNKAGFMILGSVFLASTGAEALYSDMSHVGKGNIYCSWPFVKSCLLLNYMGQGAWILMNTGNTALASVQDLNPFFIMLPEALRPVAVIMSTAAAIIASQALITGSYTLVSEAINLDLLPHLKISYPSETKGQLYIGAVNTVLMIGCTIVVLYFRSGAKIEHAYGLCITITMLMDTLLLTVYMLKIRKKPLMALFIPLIFGAIESVFFISSLAKFTHGGYFAAIMASIIFALMVIWYKGTQLEHKYNIRLKVKDYLNNFRLLHDDKNSSLCANNLVYIDRSGDMETLDRDILYSILDKDPKRADAYWFFSIHVTDEPYAARYKLETYGTDHIFRVKLELGFKNDQLLNVYIRQIVGDLLESGELPAQEKPFSIYGNSNVGTFKFCILRRSVSNGTILSRTEEIILNLKYKIREIAGSQIDWYGLKNSSLIIEHVPLSIPSKASSKQKPIRIKD